MGMSLAKLACGREDYYLRAVAGGGDDHRAHGDEAPGRWLGGGARAMVLSGVVQGSDLSAVLAGVNPQTGQTLRSRGAPVRIAAFDATFSAPKSVSILWGVGDDRTRQPIQAAHDASVSAAMGYLESEAALARRGSGPNRCQISTSGFIGASFPHRTSRRLDPHLHTHVVVANLVRGIDGRFSALDARALYGHAHTAGHLYQAQLRFELTTRLGLSWGPVRAGVAQVNGVTSQVIRHFSSRRQEVEAWLVDEARSTPRARRIAALATRPAKDYSVKVEDLVLRWRRQAEEIGFSRKDWQGVLAPMARGSTWAEASALARWSQEGAGRSLDHGALAAMARRLLGPSHLTGRSATFSQRDVLRGWCAVMESGAPVSTIRELTAQTLAGSLVLGVGSVTATSDVATSVGWGLWKRQGGGWMPGGGTVARWTTPGMVATERAMLDRVERMNQRAVREVDESFSAATLARRLALAPGQLEAASRLVSSPRPVEIVEGRVQSGALDALDGVRRLWEEKGATVVAVAATMSETQQINALTGMTCVGIDDVVSASGARPGVLVVVRPEGLRLADMAILIERAETQSARVLLVGGSGGLSYTGRGTSLATLARRPGPHLSLDEPAGWMALRSPQGLRERLVSDWWARSRAGEQVVMAAGTRREALILGHLAQEISGRPHLVALGWQVRDQTNATVLFLGSPALCSPGRQSRSRWEYFAVEGRSVGDRLGLRGLEGVRHGPEPLPGPIRDRDLGRGETLGLSLSR